MDYPCVSLRLWREKMSQLRSINKLLEACEHFDKDERYMALNDLTQQLSREDVKINTKEEGAIVAAVLKKLTDANNDVKSGAVKCVGVLVLKVGRSQIEVICRTLTDLIRSESQEDSALRDIYGIALKTLIEKVDQGIGNEVAPLLVEKLLAGMDLNATDIKRECLSILEQLLRRFGSLVGVQHSSIMKSTLCQLSLPGTENKSVRKLATDALGSLAVVISDELLNVMVNTLLKSIEKAGGVPDGSSTDMIIDDSGSDSRTLIQTIGTISRTVGHRLGRHLKRIVPLLINVIGDVSYDGTDEDRDMALLNEIREYCFSGLESFVKCCPDQIAPHLTDRNGDKGILTVAMSYIRYDPNYMGDDGDEEEGMDMSDDDDYADEYDDDDYGDDADDDSSWKVRRTAVCVVRAIIVACWADMSAYLFETCVDELINRFKERSELVRVDVMACISAILEAMNMRKRLRLQSQSGRSATGSPAMPRSESSSTLTNLYTKMPSLVSAVCKVLGGPDKELASKSAALELSIALLDVLGAPLDKALYDDLLGVLVRGLINDKLQSLRLPQMKLLRLLITTHPYDFIQASLNKTHPTDRLNIFSITIAATGEAGYKNVAEALHVAATLIPKLRPVSANGTGFESDAANYREAVKALYAALLSRLEAQDIDQEIKRFAIYCAGTLFFHFGDCFSAEVPKVLSLLSAKLDNEVTRVATLQALRQMAESPLHLEMAPILTADSIISVANFLKQQSRDTRQASAELLSSILKTNAAAVASGGPEVVVPLVKMASTLVVSADLHLAAQSLSLLKMVTTSTPQEHFASPLKEFLLPRAVKLASSPFLHGACQEAIVDFLQHLVRLNYPGMGFPELFSALYTDSKLFTRRGDKKGGSAESDNGSGSAADGNGKSEGTIKQEAQSIAFSVAGMCLGASSDVIERTVGTFADDINAPGTDGDDRRKHLALLCIGNLGQRMDLAHSGALEALSLDDKVMECFESPTSDTQTAAAFALGNLSVGNMAKYLPLLLQNMTNGGASTPKGKGKAKGKGKGKTATVTGVSDYLLLVSLREIIQAHAVKAELSFESHFASVLPVITPFIASTEMGERQVAAECMGMMTFLNPATMAPELEKICNEGAVDLDKKISTGSSEPEVTEDGPPLSAREINLRWSLATMLKFSISRDLSGENRSAVFDSVVKYLPALLQDDNVDVRKAAIILITSAVHRNRDWIQNASSSDGKPLLETVFPLLMSILQFKKVIEVDTGPFKYKEDLGLPLRKATLTCVEMMLGAIPDALNLSALIPQVILNIGDELKVKKDHNFNDLKIHAMQLLVKLCVFAPGPMLGFAEGSLEVLKKVLCEEIKENAAATDRERAMDLKRASLEVVKAYGALETMDTNPVFLDFFLRIQTSPVVSDLVKDLGMTAPRG